MLDKLLLNNVFLVLFYSILLILGWPKGSFGFFSVCGLFITLVSHLIVLDFIPVVIQYFFHLHKEGV